MARRRALGIRSITTFVLLLAGCASYPPHLQTVGTALDMADLIALHNTDVAAQAQVEKVQAALASSRAEDCRPQLLHHDEHYSSDKSLQTDKAIWRDDRATVRAPSVRANWSPAAVHASPLRGIEA